MTAANLIINRGKAGQKSVSVSRWKRPARTLWRRLKGMKGNIITANELSWHQKATSRHLCKLWIKAYCRDMWVFFHVLSPSKLRPLSFPTHRRAWSWIALHHENTFVVLIFPFWLRCEIPCLPEHLWQFKGGYLKCGCCLLPLHREEGV